MWAPPQPMAASTCRMNGIRTEIRSDNKRPAYMDVRAGQRPARTGLSQSVGADGRWELALPVPPCARMPDGLDAPVGGDCRRTRMRDRLDAATAHQLRQKHLRLPGAPQAVPGVVRPVVVGDCPTHRNIPLHRIAMEARQGPPRMEHMMALLDLAESLGLAYIFTE